MWRLGKYLSSLTKPELEELKDQLNLTENEEEVFRCLSKGKSIIETADKCGIAEQTVDKRIKEIKEKIKRLCGGTVWMR